MCSAFVFHLASIPLKMNSVILISVKKCQREKYANKCCYECF